MRVPISRMSRRVLPDKAKGRRDIATALACLVARDRRAGLNPSAN
jgi:hypothetical protein